MSGFTQFHIKAPLGDAPLHPHGQYEADVDWSIKQLPISESKPSLISND